MSLHSPWSYPRCVLNTSAPAGQRDDGADLQPRAVAESGSDLISSTKHYFARTEDDLYHCGLKDIVRRSITEWNRSVVYYVLPADTRYTFSS